MILDEAGVRRTARCREIRLPAGHRLDRAGERRDQLLVMGKEDLARRFAPGKLEGDGLVAPCAVFPAAAGAVETVVDLRLQHLDAPRVVEADVECRRRSGRD